MKRFFSFCLIFCMLFSLSVFADDYTTTINYSGTGEDNWELEVPKEMSPGETDKVILSGSWGITSAIIVSAPNTVSLVSKVDSNESISLGVTFLGINQEGKLKGTINVSQDISIANVTETLNGDWAGVLVYNVRTEEIDLEKASVNGEKYMTLQEAIDAASSGATVKLLSNVEESIVIAEDKNIILDLNGRNIIGDYLDGSDLKANNVIDSYTTIINKGSLTIIGDGIIDSKTDSTPALLNIGTAELLGGIYTRSLSNATDPSVSYKESEINNFYTVINLGELSVDDRANIISNSVKASSLANGWGDATHAGYEETGGHLIVNGGIIKGGRHAIANNIGDVEINGGSVLSRDEYGKDVIGHDDGVITINGGEVVSTTGVAITAEPNTEIVINGGKLVGEIKGDSTVIITDNR